MADDAQREPGPSDPALTQEIVDSIRGGNQQAFDDLFQRVGGKVYVYAYSRMGKQLRRVVEPEDVLQEVYAKAFAAFDDFVSSGSGSMARWLVGIARNEIRSLQMHHFGREKRDARRAVSLDTGSESMPGMQVTSDGPTPSQILARDEDVQRVANALDRLPTDEREAILMHVEGESVEGIAQKLGLPRTTLLYRLSQTLRQLGTMVDDE